MGLDVAGLGVQKATSCIPVTPNVQPPEVSLGSLKLAARRREQHKILGSLYLCYRLDNCPLSPDQAWTLLSYAILGIANAYSEARTRSYDGCL